MLRALRRAVDRRMIADVPVGVLLSGGLDSSLIVALLAEHGQTGLQTFSVGFESAGEIEGDEFEYSDLVAREFGTRHEREVVSNERVLPTLPKAIEAMSEPMTSHDVVAFYLLSQEVAKHVTVVQSGQGADEVFAGYDWYPPLDEAEGYGSSVYRRAFVDRSHEEIAPPWRPSTRSSATSRARSWRASSEVGADEPLDRALRLDTRDARRGPGQARRQHDDGLGARGARAVPGPRGRRPGRGHPAVAEGGRRGQGRDQGLPAGSSPTR